MKKYVVGLSLLIMQCVCGIDMWTLSTQEKEKCKWVARYLYKYPAGKDQQEAGQIEAFFNAKNMECNLLSLCIQKYKKMLSNQEGTDVLRCMLRNTELPTEVKYNIFAEAVWDNAYQYCAIRNTVQFINMAPHDFSTPYLCKNGFHGQFKEYFLSELNGNNDIVMMFSQSKASESHPSMELVELFIIYLTSAVKEIDVSISSYKNILTKDYYLSDMKDLPLSNVLSLSLEKQKLDQLNAFLGARKDRIALFKKELHGQIDKVLVINNEEEHINAFIELLQYFKINVLDMPYDLKHLA